MLRALDPELGRNVTARFHLNAFSCSLRFIKYIYIRFVFTTGRRNSADVSSHLYERVPVVHIGAVLLQESDNLTRDIRPELAAQNQTIEKDKMDKKDKKDKKNAHMHNQKKKA